MTQPENGGMPADNPQKGEAGTEADETMQTQLDALKADFENLKKESVAKDRTINKYQKELEIKGINSQSAEEQAKTYKEKFESLERRESLRQAFKEVGLNPEDFEQIIDETDTKLQATKFAQLIKEQNGLASQKALEDFKKQQLGKIGDTPNPKDKLTTNLNEDVNSAIRGALGR